jgi:hypothetical protein
MSQSLSMNKWWGISWANLRQLEHFEATPRVIGKRDASRISFLKFLE